MLISLNPAASSFEHSEFLKDLQPKLPSLLPGPISKPFSRREAIKSCVREISSGVPIRYLLVLLLRNAHQVVWRINLGT